jgi:glycosyltransferase involved in cell wall biosynthesis
LKVDLVMWTKNGKATLPAVLSRISKVVPKKCVNKKIIVDDGSVDGTVRIAEAHGWTVIPNEGTGISCGANTALKNVESEYFCSFEQDLLLSSDWWSISRMLKGKVAVVSGMRFASQSPGLIALQKYVAKKYRGEALSSWLRSREMSSFTLGKTLDNTIYRTDVMLEIGGFPQLKTIAGVDTVLAYKILGAGYEWVVNYNVQSTHIRRNGLREELEHQFFYGTQLAEIWDDIEKTTGMKPPMDRAGVLFRLLASPLTGAFVAVKTWEPSVLVVHPLVKLSYTYGLLKTGEKAHAR